MSTDGRTPKPRWVCTYQSDRIDGTAERMRVKAALRTGNEPEPEYRSGKLWND